MEYNIYTSLCSTKWQKYNYSSFGVLCLLCPGLCLNSGEMTVCQLECISYQLLLPPNVVAEMIISFYYVIWFL